MAFVYIGKGQSNKGFLVRSEITAGQAQQFLLLNKISYHVTCGFIEWMADIGEIGTGTD